MITRRAATIATCSGLAAGLFRPGLLRAAPAEFAYKWGASFDSQHPIMLRVGEALNQIRADTDGAVDIKLFTNGQLGGDTDMVSQLRSGVIQFISNSGIGISGLVPGADISDMPFAFKSYDQVWGAMDGELGAYVRKLVADANLYLFPAFFDLGYRTFTSKNKPVNSPAELKGFKIRIPPSKMLISMFQALGAAPMTMNVGETFTALQTGLVDGQDNPLSQTFFFKFYEVQKYCALSHHSWTGVMTLANNRALDALPAKYRQVVEQRLFEAAQKERADFQTLETSLRARLEANGMVFSTPDIDAFRGALKAAAFYAQTRQRYGDTAFALVEKYAGPLA